MGRWGDPFTRSKWDCEGYAAQTPDFVARADDGTLRWGYTGQRTDEAREGITVADARWLYRYLSRITDAQLRDGLRASGAAGAETECFTRAIRERISRLGRICDGSGID
jgi:hypothetical protein